MFVDKMNGDTSSALITLYEPIRKVSDQIQLQRSVLNIYDSMAQN